MKKLFTISTLSLLAVAGIVFATPPGSKYTPGETSDPTCAPGDTNCTVAVLGKFRDGIDPNEAVYTSGNVGVGIDNPTYTMDIQGLGGRHLRVNSIDDFAEFRMQSNRSSVAGDWSFGSGLSASAALANTFYIWDYIANTARLTINSNGNIGIGLNDATEKLTVAGNIKTTGNVISSGSITSGSITSGGAITSGSLSTTGDIKTNQYLRVDSWAGYGTGTAKIWYDGVGGSGSSTGYLGFGTIVNDQMALTNGGNLGIGTINPGSKLSVVGLPSGTSAATASPAVTGSFAGAVCITTTGDMYTDTDGVCN